MKNWKEEALKLRAEGHTYRNIARLLEIPEGSVNSLLAKSVTPTPEKVLKLLVRGIESPSTEVFDIIQALEKDGYNIEEREGKYYLCKSYASLENCIEEDWKGDRIIRFGVVSDTHLGNKFQQMTYLNEFYDTCLEQGISTVYHAGDMTDGYYTSRGGQVYELFKIGFDEQKNYIVDNYPKRNGIITKFILGNHDMTHVINGGANLGRPISVEREDMVYLGDLNAKVYLTPNCVMELNHPLDGSAYSISYSIQKLMESYSGQEKPNILINGHHHKVLYMFYRNIHGLEAGCFEAQTPFMKGKRLRADVGGFIVTVHVDEDGTITRFVPEFYPVYYSKKNDF